MLRIFLYSALCCMCIEVTSSKCAYPYAGKLNFTMRTTRSKYGEWIADVNEWRQGAQEEVESPLVVVSCETWESVLLESKFITTEKEDFVQIGHYGFYKFYYKDGQLKNWRQAAKVCAEENSKLIVIRSQEEASALGMLWERVGLGWHFAYVGFREEKKDVYKTVENTTLEESGYEGWRGGKPTKFVQATPDAKVLHCGVFDRNGEYVLQDCVRERPFLCKKDEL